MPKEIELHLRGIDNLQLCYQTAKDLLTILQIPVVAKMSTLSLAQSRSPSPTHPRTRSPSPRNNRQTRVGAGRARLFRHPPGLNYRINEYYLHVSSVNFLLYY